jgi:hypothetical protein
MPETAMNKYDSPVFSQLDIGRTWKFSYIDPEPEPVTEQLRA